MARAGATQHRRVQVGKTFTLGLVAGVIGLVANTVAAFVTTWSGTLAWLAVPAASVGVAIAGAFATAHVQTQFPPGKPDGEPPAPPARGGMSLPVVIGLVVVVLGLGGLGVAFGVKYAVGWVTGNEEGVDRLAAVAQTESSGLRLSVQRYDETRHFTRLTVTATNGVRHSLTLPLRHPAAAARARLAENPAASAGTEHVLTETLTPSRWVRVRAPRRRAWCRRKPVRTP